MYTRCVCPLLERVQPPFPRIYLHRVVVGQLVCVGMIIVKQTFVETPSRWYPAVILGLALCFSDLMINPYIGSSNPAVSQIASGYVFKSFGTTWVLSMIIDRWFGWAALVFILMVPCTLTACKSCPCPMPMPHAHAHALIRACAVYLHRHGPPALRRSRLRL